MTNYYQSMCNQQIRKMEPQYNLLKWTLSCVNKLEIYPSILSKKKKVHFLSQPLHIAISEALVKMNLLP